MLRLVLLLRGQVLCLVQLLQAEVLQPVLLLRAVGPRLGLHVASVSVVEAILPIHILHVASLGDRSWQPWSEN